MKAQRTSQVSSPEKIFYTISETAKLTGLSVYGLRMRKADGKLPGIYMGNRFFVNVPALLNMNDSKEN